jgi:acetyl esterase/lipase
MTTQKEVGMTGGRRWALGGLVLLLGWVALGYSQERPEGERLPEGVMALQDMEYARIGKRPLLLDLYLPVKAEGRLPLIVWIHGGAWRGGSKDRTPAVALVPRGYAVASVGYRLSQEATFPAQIEDCKGAVRWLRARAGQYGLDPDRFGAWGPSAGGHLVALLGTSGGVKELEGRVGDNPAISSGVQAVCDWFGPTDFLQMDAHAPAGSQIRHNAPDSPESQLIGGPIQENKEKVARANPITYVTKDDPPFLIIHGDEDNLVPIHQSELLHQALQRAGVESTFVRLKGAGHGGPAFNSTEVRQRVTEFFDRHLKSARREVAAE